MVGLATGTHEHLMPAFSQYIDKNLGRMFSTLLLNSETIHICYLG